MSLECFYFGFFCQGKEPFHKPVIKAKIKDNIENCQLKSFGRKGEKMGEKVDM